MINSRTIFMGILLAIMVVGLSGCKITSASPDPGTVIEMKPGDKQLFKVVGPVNTATTKCIWYVAKMNSDYIGDLDYKNEQMVLERSNKYEFTVDPNGEQTNRIKIRCEYWSYEFGPDSSCYQFPCFPDFEWRKKGSRTWDIRLSLIHI